MSTISNTAHIELNNSLPGIVGLFKYSPETAKPMSELAEVLLRGPSTLTTAEREMIASWVSYDNECHFCHTSHGAAVAHKLDGDLNIIDDIKQNFTTTKISDERRALLQTAKEVQILGNKVTSVDIENARKEGATDMEIHHTVLIAAAFCMYNRYVDGLGTWAPKENEEDRKSTRLNSSHVAISYAV